MKTREITRYALMLLVVVLLIRALPFLSAMLWYGLPLVLVLFLFAPVVLFFNKAWALSSGQPKPEYDAAHSWKGKFYQFLRFVEERRVINGLWKIFVRALVIVMVVTGSAYFLGKSYWQRRNTQTEISQISQAMEWYKHESKGYPEKLEMLVGNNPLKRDWETDGWGNSYAYEVAPDKQTCTLVSKGKDGVLRTGDDIIAKKE